MAWGETLRSAGVQRGWGGGEQVTRRRTVTITDISQRVGCSISTVSAAMNGTTGVSPQLRRKILRAARDMGYQPNESARRLRRHRPRLIGVSHVLGQSFQTDLLDGIYVASREAGYDVMLAAVTANHGEDECLKVLVENRCEAVVVIGSVAEPERLAVVADRVPVVAFSYEREVAGLDVVNSQDELGIDLLVDHVVGTGRREVWYVDGRQATQSRPRSAAYRHAMARHGLADRVRVFPGGTDEAAGIAAARTVVAGGRLPEALLAYNDDLALGMLMELRRRGVAVPDEVALAGFDGTPLTGVPGIDLTTVRQHAATMARAAVTRLIDRLDASTGVMAGTVVGSAGFVAGTADGATWETVERVGGVEMRVEPTLIPRESTRARS